MKIRIRGITKEDLPRRAPELLQKAAQAMNVILVEKEPTFEEKAFLPHTNKVVAKLEDWYYQTYNHALDSLKQDIVRQISGKALESKGIVNRTSVVEKKPSKTTSMRLQKSRIALIHLKNILSNPDVNKRTRKQIYDRAKQIMEISEPNERQKLIDVFLEIRDLT